MIKLSTPWLPPPGRAAILLLGLLAAPAAAVVGDPPAETAVIARVDGAPVTAGKVREIQRITGPGGEGAAAALDLAIDGLLFYAESVRRGLNEEPAVAAAIAHDSGVLLVEQYVIATRGAELRQASDPGIHSSPKMTGKHGGMMSEAAQLRKIVDQLEKEAAKRTAIEFLPDVYQKPNERGGPRGQLVVARAGGVPILWSEVEEAEQRLQGLEPPLEGIPAMRFVNGIRMIAGRRALRKEAEAALPTFRDEYDRTRERLVRSLVTRRLLALEVDAKVSLGEEELRSYFEKNRARYDSATAPATFEQVKAKVAMEAERDAKAALRAALAKQLRAAAKIDVDQALLESLEK